MVFFLLETLVTFFLIQCLGFGDIIQDNVDSSDLIFLVSIFLDSVHCIYYCGAFLGRGRGVEYLLKVYFLKNYKFKQKNRRIICVIQKVAL